MLLLIRLSLRNLFRQKRRNLMLGSAMAVGVVLLVMANSFSRGLSDIMMNKVMRWVTGHVTVGFNDRGHVMSEFFRDRDRVLNILQGFDDVILEKEEVIGVFCRAIGNGKADNIILVGTELEGDGKLSEKDKKEMEESFRLVEGKWEDLKNSQVENPAIISVEKARYLNVKLNDVLRLRLRNIYSQDQSARITVVGIIKNDNIFMQPVAFVEQSRAKAILGFDAHSTGTMNLVIKEPEKNAKKLADAIHKKFSSNLAVIDGVLESAGGRGDVSVFGFRSDPESRHKLFPMLKVTAGSAEQAWKDKAALVAGPLAKRLGLKPGDAFSVRYTDKWGEANVTLSSRVAGIFDPGAEWGQDVVLVHDARFYDVFYPHWPSPARTEAFVPDAKHAAYSLLAPEWILLPRTSNTDEAMKKMKEMGSKKWQATLVDVRTMYETASEALKLEGVINLITFSAVLVLLVITLLGVVNTLRMTIRERTREIGTIRAIGMQRRDVMLMFLLETLFLALFASLVGAGIALLAMAGISAIPFTMDDNPMGMFLVNSRLYFMPTVVGIAGNISLILILAVVTAYFPSRRASKLAPSAALRHFE